MRRTFSILYCLLAIGVCAGFDRVITEPTSIAPNDVSYDGMSVLVDGATVTLDGAHGFTSLHLTNGACLTHTAGLLVGMDLTISNDLCMADSAAIDVSGKGYPGATTVNSPGSGPGGGNSAWYRGGGAGHGGMGAASIYYGSPVAGGSAYGDILLPQTPGSGGGGMRYGGGGNGGGVVKLRVQGALLLNGSVLAQGHEGYEDPTYHGGPGAGGSIWIQAGRLAGSGAISANGGGQASGDSDMGGGGGGRIAIETATNHFTGTVTAFGGYPIRAAAGTVSIADTSQSTTHLWLANDGNSTFDLATPLTNDQSFTTVTLSSGAYLQLSASARLTADQLNVTNGVSCLGVPALSDFPPVFHDVTICSNATLTHPTCDDTHDWALKLRVISDLIVQTNASLSARGKGYPGGIGGDDFTAGYGTGGGMAQWYVGGGGSHGGTGGTSSDGASGGPCYGSETYPTTAGSGGGGTRTTGGGMPGGGVISLQADGAICLDGLIDASGVDYVYPLYHGGGGGAGGSVLLVAPSISGSGRIDASGGDAHTFDHQGGGGGGGRVAIYAHLDGYALTNVCVNGGAYGSPPSTAGTIHHYDGIPPAVIDGISLVGFVTQAVHSLTITFLSTVAANSISTDDITVTGPQSCVVSEVAVSDGVTVVASFATDLTADGEYSVLVGPHIESFAGGAMDGDGDGTFGEDPDDTATFSFMIDLTPPAAPTVTNFLAAPSVNIVNTSLPEIRGLKDSNSSILYEAQPVVPAGSSTWTNRTPINVGSSTIGLVARDPAGNESVPTTMHFLCDMLEPQVLATTPADGAVIAGQPSITVTCSDLTSGPDLPASILQVTSAGVAVAGHWTYRNAEVATFTPAAILPDGAYEISVTLRDRAGMVADPYVTTFEIVTPAPTTEDLQPAWWSCMGVMDVTSDDTNDFAALNSGQLKWMAHCAAEAFDAHLAFGTGSDVDDLIDGFSNAQNHHAANVGQLKTVAAPFYDRLGLALPWEGAQTTNEWALANVGQLKHLFDLHLSADDDADGLPDWWEIEHFGSKSLHDAADDSDGDGLTTIEEYENRTLPDAADSDLDSVSDLQEVLLGSDPADAASFPVNVSGAVAYAGPATGTTYVVAATAATAWEGRRCERAAVPASYVITNAVRGRSNWIKAFLDADGNGVCDAWEPVGIAADAPHSLVQVTTGLDIVLQNPDLDGDGMDDIWEMSQLGSTLPTPGSDADGDGVSNLDEFVQGTDPLSPDAESDASPSEAQTVAGDLGLKIFTPIE